MASSVEIIDDAIKNYLIEFGENVQGNLLEKIRDYDIAKEISLEINLDNDNDWFVFLNMPEYWKYIEYGRGPGKQPPIDKMLKFVKKITPTPYQLPSGKRVIPTEKQLAFLIGRKIGKDGVQGKYYLKETLEELEFEFIEGLKKVLVTKIKEIFK